MSAHEILCGNCGSPVDGPEDPKPHDEIRCPKCGQSDPYSAVLESAQKFVTDEVARTFNKTMADAVRGSKVAKFKPDHIPNRRYRWTVADFDL